MDFTLLFDIILILIMRIPN